MTFKYMILKEIIARFLILVQEVRKIVHSRADFV
jgi:hypothetical protein